MAKRPGQKITMTSIDELLCVPDTEGTVDIEVESIYPFENHPFKVVDDEKMEELVESIKVMWNADTIGYIKKELLICTC